MKQYVIYGISRVRLNSSLSDFFLFFSSFGRLCDFPMICLSPKCWVCSLHWHKTQTCQVKPQCTNKDCEKMDPKVCRNFSAKGECSHNERCTCFHQQPDNLQLIFNETVVVLISRHKLEIETLNDQTDTCKCTSESVCDQCVDYWVQKGQQ